MSFDWRKNYERRYGPLPAPLPKPPTMAERIDALESRVAALEAQEYLEGRSGTAREAPSTGSGTAAAHAPVGPQVAAQTLPAEAADADAGHLPAVPRAADTAAEPVAGTGGMDPPLRSGPAADDARLGALPDPPCEPLRPDGEAAARPTAGALEAVEPALPGAAIVVPAWVPETLADEYRDLARARGEEYAAGVIRQLKRAALA